MASSSGAAGYALVRPWWERNTVPCRDATPSGCLEHSVHTLECSTDIDPATGEPVKRCVKLYQRYFKCAGRPLQQEEQKQEMTARGEGAERLEPNLGVELPTRLVSPDTSSSGGAQMEDVGHAFEEFLRFAEELQEQMVPGVMLDQAPPAAARPYSEPEGGQQQQEQQQAGEQPVVAWLGGLLFGKRRADASGGSGGSGRQRVDSSTWRDFEKEITEI